MDSLEALSRLQREPVEALRALRNIVTGRELKKIELIYNGLIPALEQCLSQAGQDAPVKLWSDAAAAIAVIANTGTPFTAPILKSNLIPTLVSHLRENSDHILVSYTSLQCLNSIADNLPMNQDETWSVDDTLARHLYSKENANVLVNILNSNCDRANSSKHQATKSTLELILKTCTSERYKTAIIEAGIFATITSYLTKYWTRAKQPKSKESQRRTTCRQELHPIFSIAMNLVCQLTLTSTKNLRKFLNEGFLESCTDNAHGVSTDFHASYGHMVTGKRSQFPPLGYSTCTSTTTKRRKSSALQEPGNLVLEDSDEDSESDWRDISWLLQIVRSRRHECRVMAARLIAILKIHGFIHPGKVRQLGSLLVPILVEMLGCSNDTQINPDDRAHLQIPSTLALLVRDCETLQDAAVAAGAIPKLTNALKLNLETKHDLATELWSPNHLRHKFENDDPACKLGLNSPSARTRKNMQHREGILQALAAIAPTKDSHRKEICDYGAVTQIILALEPSKWSTTTGKYSDTLISCGNSADAVIAACAAIRALTRSATALRTKLVDVDVAKSIIHLLQSSDPEVRIAATMVMANLAHDFSPMKSSIADQYVIRKLCEQAHSANPRLRHESLFALKALVNNSNNTLKQQVVEELGPSWIKHLIATDPRDVPPGEVIGLVPVEYRKGSRIRTTSDVEMEDLDTDGESDADFSRRTLQQDIDIQAELLAFLRNLTTGENAVVIVDYLMQHIGLDDFLQAIVERLQTAELSIRKQPSQASQRSSPEIITNSLFILAHMCAAKPAYRTAICYHTVLMKQMTSLLKARSAMVRCAVCWLVNNIIYPTNNREIVDAIPRAREIQKLGISTEVKRLESSDSSPDVVERARTVSDVLRQLLSTS